MPSRDGPADQPPLQNILDALDGEVRGLLEQDDARLLIGLARLLELLEADATLAAAVTEVRSRASRREQDFIQHDAHLMGQIRALWSQEARLFEWANEAATAKGQEALFNSLGRRLQSFESALASPGEVKFPVDEEIDHDPSRSAALLKLLHHQHNWIPDQNDKERVGRTLRAFIEQHDREWRRFWLDGRNLAGVAHLRLEHASRTAFDLISSSDADPGELKLAADGVRRDVQLLHRSLRTETLLRVAAPRPAAARGKKPAR